MQCGVQDPKPLPRLLVAIPQLMSCPPPSPTPLDWQGRGKNVQAPVNFFSCSDARRAQQPLIGAEITSAHGQWVQNYVQSPSCDL